MTTERRMSVTGRAATGAVVAAVVLLVAACSDDDSPAAETGEPRREAFDHIHGLGVVDDLLYVASHKGLFTISSDGDAAVASEDDHDFMGFTVADTGELLASGHPNSRRDLPGHLGLLESTDGGATWDELSLSGEVDFHALDASSGSVYGYDSVSGQLLGSTDRRSWSSLGQVPLADVAISPDDGATLLITTEQGPQLSADAGKSFAVIDGAPLLMLVDWPRTDQLYGISPDGTIHHSIDAGATWEARGNLGAQPQAMTVSADGTIYVALEGSIVASSDGGETFTPYYTAP